LSQSNEYHHLDSQWERWKQIVTLIVCRGASYLAMEMKFCVSLSICFAMLDLMEGKMQNVMATPQNWLP
jgi:hypothetical protein